MKYDDPDDLRAAIRSVGIPALHEACGIPKTTLQSFLDGKSKNMRGDNLKMVIGTLKALNGEDELLRVASSGEEHAVVPIFDIRASAGAGALVDDGEPSDYQPFRLVELDRYNIADLVVIQVGGDSMWDTLHDGDMVMVDRSVERIVKSGIYVISFEGELLVKRCQRNLETGAVIVESDNKDYATFTVNDPASLLVVGRVVRIGRFIG